MKIVSVATRRPVTVVVFFVALVMFGVISFRELPVDLLPDLSFPTLTIRTEYPGVAPADVETFVTTPIEDAVGIVSGVVDIASVSRAGLSDVIMEFAWGTDMDFAAIDVREQLAQLGLPAAAEDPILLRFDPALDPIMRISVGSAVPGDVTVADQAGLRLLAEQSIKQRLESIDGVAAAIVAGGVEEEIQINVDQSRSALLGIPLSQIASRLQRENVDVTGGSIADGAAEYVVRVLARFADLDEIGRIVVGEVGDVQVRLQDLADVRSGYQEQSTITRTNRRPSVEISIHKEAAANTVAVAQAVKERLGEVEQELEGVVDVELRVVSDQSRFIEQSIRDVIQAALLGGVLAIAVLYLFVRRLRSTLVVGLAIPISVIASFFLMFLGGVSLNIMSLGGLALGIGMLVDSSIVVLESIERHRVAGADRGTAARTGGAEVGSAVVAATLTTLCVFIPVVFVSGIAGQLFVDPALTVTFSLLVSLAVALTLIPMASAVGAATDPPVAPPGAQVASDRPAPAGTAVESDGQVEGPAPPEAAEDVARELLSVRVAAAPGRGMLAVVRGAGVVLRLLVTPLAWLFENLYGVVNVVYPQVLGWALRRRLLVIVLAVVLLAGSLSLVPLLGAELIPEIRQGTIVVDVELPPGTPVARTDATLAEMQRLAAELPAVAQTYAVAGSSRTGDEEVRENSGQILIDLHPEYRRRAEDRALAQLREALAGVPGAAVTFGRPPLLTFDAAVEARIGGAAPAVLERAAQAVAGRLAEVTGLADVSARVAGTSPEVVIRLNRGQLAELDLDAEAVGEIVAAKLQGEVPTELERGRQDVALRVRTRPEDRATIEDLAGLIVTTVGDVPVPLSAVAAVTVADGANEIRRVDQRRVVLVAANLDGRDLGSVTDEVQAVLDGVQAEFGVDAELAGQWQDMVESFDSMQLALILALILTYLVMAAQFESLLHPLIILAAVPFGLVGVVLTLAVFAVPVSAIALIGVIMMAGIVVNNAIVLVDYINQLRRRGMEPHAAIRQAAVTRVRPILMTTATTVLGLVPLALRLGDGWELRQPLAVTVIGGLLFSTLITLVLVPILYSLIGGHGVRRDTARATADDAALEVSP
ncbi:MAG: efflux RND transporter permease subunit [Spirochaetaceae bacterium]|nr:efflux RND transporter permease subunit [Spirochaetaceae bacterium]